MANEEHLLILDKAISSGKMSIWNTWRENNPRIKPDLSNIKLSNLNLTNANLNEANLDYVDLREATLYKAQLVSASLNHADLLYVEMIDTNLTNASLTNIDLTNTNLYKSKLIRADLTDATLNNSNLTNTILSNANLTNTNLRGANFTNAMLDNTQFEEALCFQTIFANVDLSCAKNLDTIHHIGPSTIGIDTLYMSEGNIPEIFLEGCGVPDNMITYAKSLVDKPIDYYSVFISYSTNNEDFAQLLYNTLQGAGIRCWYAPEQLLPGQRIDDGIHRGIQYWDKVLFCASKSSLTEKWWVDFEVDKAFKKSRDLQRERGEQVGVLIPLNLDGYMFSAEYKNHPRASQFETTLAADFVGWKNDMDKFNQEVKRVIKALQTDGGLEEPPPSKL